MRGNGVNNYYWVLKKVLVERNQSSLMSKPCFVVVTNAPMESIQTVFEVNTDVGLVAAEMYTLPVTETSCKQKQALHVLSS